MKFSNITRNDSKIENFYTFYKKYFPPQERDTLSTIKKLAHNTTFTPDWDYVIVEATDHGKNVAGLIYDWFPDINVLIIEFIFVAEAYRHHKIAKRLIDRLKHNIPDITILVEVEKDGPARSFWDRMNFAIASQHYLQPPLGAHQPTFDGLILMSNRPVKNLQDILQNHYWKYAFFDYTP